MIPTKLVLKPFDINSFSKLFDRVESNQGDDGDIEEEQKYTKHLPMDWSLKTRLRFFCESELPSTQLKTQQSASSLTSFVRCVESQTEYSGLDNSFTSRFHRASYYWQYPYIPWMTLYPRKSRNNVGVVLGERERKALANDWDDSFRGLFHLLRSKQCAYFYLCANTFTVLFRASGIGGCNDIHALMSPTTSGIRKALRDDGINYSMPLKRNFAESMNGTMASESNSKDEFLTQLDCSNEDDDDWLANLEVDNQQIRRIQSAHHRTVQSLEMTDDHSDASLILIEGAECQGFFSFLLNSKSTISNVGRLAGVPPTLLAPVAFPKASMAQVSLRSSKVRMDNVDYYSVELKGTILPTILPYLCSILNETKETYSFAVNSSIDTLAFSKATIRLLQLSEIENGTDAMENQQFNLNNNDPENSKPKENKIAQSSGVIFTQKNLSDSGLNQNVLECICRTGEHAVALLERVCFDKQQGYAWS